MSQTQMIEQQAAPADAAEIQKMLVLSTVHLSPTDCNKWMHSCPWTCFEKGDYGWFMDACDDEGIYIQPGVPLADRSALTKAHQLGCDWIMFDRDGPALDDLPVYDW